MRISDWSSDVCSSDLQDQARAILAEVKSLRPAPGIDPLETISRWKEKLVGPGAALREAEGRPDLQPLAQVYAYYQKALSDRGYWDFSDLIVRAVSAFRASPALCEQISRQFRHVLVDEAPDKIGSTWCRERVCPYV